MNVIKSAIPRIPSEYTQVEYIQADSNTQYINCNFTPTGSKLKIIAKAGYTDAATGRFFLWGGTTANVTHYSEFASNKFGSINAYTSPTLQPNTLYDVSQTIIPTSVTGAGTSHTIKVGDMAYSSSQKSYTGSFTNMYLFRLGSASYPGTNSRLGEVKFINDGVLARDFVPVKKNSNNEYGMYDLVTKSFYGNSGTGSFTGGDPATNPLMEDVYYGNIKIQSRYQPATSSDTSVYPQMLTGYTYEVLDGTEAGWQQSSSAGVFHRGTEYVPILHGTYAYSNKYTPTGTRTSISSMPDMSLKTNGTVDGYLYMKNKTYGDNLEGFKAYLADAFTNNDPVINLYSSNPASSLTWDFYKDTFENVYGYFCKHLNLFIPCADATGTQSSTIVYDHFMLKGGDN